MIAKILENNGTGQLRIQCEEQKKKFKTGILEIKEVTRDYEIYLKLNGLYHKFISVLSKETGDTELYWKHRFKKMSSFGEFVWDDIDQCTEFIDWPFSYESTTWQQRSELFKNSFLYCLQDNIIDCDKFMQEYKTIIGKDLIVGV